VTAAAILAEIEQLDRDRAVLMERLRAALAGNVAAVLDAPPVAPAQPVDHLETLTDSIQAGDAAALARRAKSTIAAWCYTNAIDDSGRD
jgi:hypothetical protein